MITGGPGMVGAAGGYMAGGQVPGANPYGYQGYGM